MATTPDPVVVIDYDPRWVADFERLRERVASALGRLALDIQHVGSTAVPGLPAKPVIDMDVIIRSPEDLPRVIERLRVQGYEHKGDQGVAGRETFRWPSGEARHHLYVCLQGSDELRRHLMFRDYLRSHPEQALRYGDLKRKIGTQFRHDRRRTPMPSGRSLKRSCKQPKPAANAASVVFHRSIDTVNARRKGKC
jgi:GrpB-like predicted nucleotidyltransferase (UPF0157 family)